MRLNVVKAASARLAASLLLLTAAPAFAGDAAGFDPIGFSEDGRFFAYEEYGIQDGSGFPYANVFLVDLIADKWVGSPTRVRLDDDTAGLDEARAQALAKAKSALDGAALVTPAQPLFLHGDAAVGGDNTATFGFFGNGLDTPSDPMSLALETFDSTSSEPCASYGMADPVQGFGLVLTDASGNSAEIHRDTAVPASRGCVSDYRIYGVLSPFPYGSASPLVAVVSVYSLGFEGPDRRFVTVPIVP